MSRKTKIVKPIIYSLFVFAIAMPFIWGILNPLFIKMPEYYGGAFKYFLSLLSSLGLCFALDKGIKFSLKNKNFLEGLFSYGLLGIICAVAAMVFSYSPIDHSTTPIKVIGYILYCLMIAMSEEFIFRGMILHRFIQSKNGIFTAVIFSSLIFGIRHFLNLITMPNTVISTIGQVLFTFMAGFYLCAVYIKTDNIWICVLIHFMEDFSTGFWALVSSEAYASQNVDGEILQVVLLVVVHSIYIIFGVLMLKKDRKKLN